MICPDTSDATNKDAKNPRDDFYKERLQELERENEHLKSIKSSLQSHLKLLMKKIRHIKLATPEDLPDENDSLNRAGIRFSITDSNGLSSRYTTLFDSLEDFSINQDVQLSGLEDFVSTDSQSSYDSYTDLNTYSATRDKPPDIKIARKQILASSEDLDFDVKSADIASAPTTATIYNEQPFLLPEDLKGSILSPEIVIKSPRKPRNNRQRMRIVAGTAVCNIHTAFSSQPTSPDSLRDKPEDNIPIYQTINVSKSKKVTSPIIDISMSISTYHASMNREELTLTPPPNVWRHYSNPISLLIPHLPFYTCVNSYPRLAKLIPCPPPPYPHSTPFNFDSNNAHKSHTTNNQNNPPSGSSSSFEVVEQAANPFTQTISKMPPLSSLEIDGFFHRPPEHDTHGESHYSELPSRAGNNNGNVEESQSDSSVEYCLPPDEGSTLSNSHPIDSRPPKITQQVSISKQTPTLKSSQSTKRPPILKKGILRKLNKNFKIWSTYWCILTHQGLFFYNIKYRPKKEENILLNNKPIKSISVETMDRVDGLLDNPKSTNDFHLGSFSICFNKSTKLYTLATGNESETLEWLRAIKSIIIQHKAYQIMQLYNNQLLHQGWLTRVKWGCSKRLWCCLLGKYLVYFNSKHDHFPTGYRCLQDCMIETNNSKLNTKFTNWTTTNSPSSEFSDCFDFSDLFYTISLSQIHNSIPIFLCFTTEPDFKLWLHYLKLSIRTNSIEFGERKSDTVEFNSVVRGEYKDKFIHLITDINCPIAITTNDNLTNQALQLWKALQRLASLEHYIVTQEIVWEKQNRLLFLVGMVANNNQPSLKDELYLQLIKQTNLTIGRVGPTIPGGGGSGGFGLGGMDGHFGETHGSMKKSHKISILCGGGGGAADSVSSSNSTMFEHRPKSQQNKKLEENSILAMWETLGILIPICLPSPAVLVLLRKYLLTTRDLAKEAEIRNYASYCFELLNQIRQSSTSSTSSSSVNPATTAPITASNSNTDQLMSPVTITTNSASYPPLHNIRIRPPSLFEITAISMRNPYTHSLPFSLPVYLECGSYQVVSFGPLSSIEFILNSIQQSLFSPEFIRPICESCSFAIYLVSPQLPCKFTYLHPQLNICDVISQYESTQSTQSTQSVIKLYFRITACHIDRLMSHFTHSTNLFCQEILKLLAYQIQSLVKLGHFSLSSTQLLQLVSLLCTAYYLENATLPSDEILVDLLPNILTNSTEKINFIKSIVTQQQQQQQQQQSQHQPQATTPTICYNTYLETIKHNCWHQFSSNIFPCYTTVDSDSLPNQLLIILCQDSSLVLLDYKCRICVKKIPISDILSFGSNSQHQMIVVYSTTSSVGDTRRMGGGGGGKFFNSTSPASPGTGVMGSRSGLFRKLIFALPDICALLELTEILVFSIEANRSQ